MGISCNTAFERLLEADPVELEGRGDSELAAHVRECRRCSAVAAKLLEGQERLATELNGMSPGVAVERALAAARARRRQKPGWRRVLRWAAPLAAAAAVAGVFFLRTPDTSRMPGEIVLRPVPRIEPLVEMPVGRNVMVFETKDESAKVIWFY